MYQDLLLITYYLLLPRSGTRTTAG
ncbi:hypothetical protein Xen7305DRAFT_00019430, partial [Xenococcus sp. PCC 7305]